jgi:hypothetical protein
MMGMGERCHHLGPYPGCFGGCGWPEFAAAHDRKMQAMSDLAQTDLDETRRLLYMALAAPRTKRYNLVGTLVNALAHHGLGVNPIEAMANLINAVEQPDNGEAAGWVHAQIDRIAASGRTLDPPQP